MQNTNIKIDYLRCASRQNPAGIDNLKPRLSWIIDSNEPGQKQTAYRIIVSSSQKQFVKSIGDLWDTGKVPSDNTAHISYKGKELVSGQSCFWKVKVWDKDDRESEWSDPGFWSMGLLDDSEWQAKWIGKNRNLKDYKLEYKGKELFLPPSPFLRKQFAIGHKPVKATLYATALGAYEMRLNGKRVGDDYFTPGWTDFKKRLYYQTYDVTNMLKKGENILGGILADGWYAGYVGFCLDQDIPNPRNHYGETPALLCQLELLFENGEKQFVVSDGTWKSSLGPILEADMQMGETYDARKELVDWDLLADIGKNWDAVDIFEPKVGKLEAYPSVPIKQTAELKPVSVSESEENTFIFNFGQNFSGVAKIKVSGKAGQKITIRYGEMLHPDGRLMTENLRFARATDIYFMRGDEVEIWRPKFTYHGFQYVEIRGLTEKPGLDAVTGIVLNSICEPTSSFECSNQMINKLYSNILWTQRANFFEIPTDCPQRDERCGWSGDAQIYARSAAYNADVLAFLNKWLVDLGDAQKSTGEFTDWAPYSFVFKKEQASGWRDAGIIVPHILYKMYGDVSIIEKHYDAMKKFINYLENISVDFLLPSNSNDWGDWLAIGKDTSLDYLATVFYAYDVKLFVEMAAVLGKTKDVTKFESLFSNIKNAFVEKYISSDGRISEDTQTSYALALYFGLVPEDLCESAAAHLVQLIEENGGKLATGFLGVKHLLPVLSEYGYVDHAYRLLISTEFPSWGYSVVNGATTIWERWNSYTIEDGFNKDGMNSFCHYAFGSVCEWMFAYMAGIDMLEPGFKRILFKPQPWIGMDFVNATYRSAHGEIKSSWRIENDVVHLAVKVPVNTTLFKAS
jgi:alpha-L-rhamnosidase